MAAAVQVQRHGALEHVAEFLALVGRHFLGLSAFVQLHQNGLHFVFLGAGHQPGDASPQGIGVLLHKHVGPGEHRFFLGFRFREEFLQIAAQAFQHIGQRGDGGRGQISFHLGNKTLAQLAPVGHFLLGQISLQPQAAQLVADVHSPSPPLRKMFSIAKQKIAV